MTHLQSLRWGIQLLIGERAEREGGGRETTERGEREGGSQEDRKSTGRNFPDGGWSCQKRPGTDRSESEMDTVTGGEVSTSQSQSGCKKGHMTNIYLTYSDEEAIVDSVKVHEESYNQ